MKPDRWRPADRNPAEVRRGLNTRADAAGIKARDAARILIRYADDDRRPPLERDEMYGAVGDLIDEMFRWKDAWASEHVDKDRKVRAAMARSVDCGAHGDEIRGLASEVTRLDKERERLDTTRLVLLGWFQQCVDLVAQYREQEKRRDTGLKHQLPTAGEIIAAFDRQLPKVRDRYMRAWKTDKRKAADK